MGRESALIKSIGLSLILIFVFACTSKVQKPSFNRGQVQAADGEGEPYDPGETGDSSPEITPNDEPAVVVPSIDPNLKTSIALSPTALALGLKKISDCARTKSEKGNKLGAYINFEVVEAGTQVSFSVNGLCGDLAAKSKILIFSAIDRRLITSVDLPPQALSSKTLLLTNVPLDKGRFSLALEVAGTRADNLASLLVDGGELVSNKAVRLESITDY